MGYTARGIPWEVGREMYTGCMKFTARQRAILAGTILGDGYVQKTGENNSRLRLEHGEKQKEYVLWKGKQFPKLFNGAPKQITREHPGTKKTYTYWRWQSNSTPELGVWHAQFYPEGKKRIPDTLAKMIRDSLALAVWYMDDGYYSQIQKHSFLYLGRVSRHEADITARAIKANFALNVRVYDKKNKGFALFFPVEETKKLHALISGDMLPVFKYKLSLTP
jgi:hypothetical protein